MIDWNKEAAEIERQIRAFAGWPRSRTNLGDIDMVITKAHVLHGIAPQNKPGTLVIEEKAGCLAIECGNGLHLCVEQLIPAGKKEMPIAAFLHGYGNRLESNS